jgi:hypothetical protein
MQSMAVELAPSWNSVAIELIANLKDAKCSNRNGCLFKRCKSVVVELAPY